MMVKAMVQRPYTWNVFGEVSPKTEVERDKSMGGLHLIMFLEAWMDN
jgi:hypothetical protein